MDFEKKRMQSLIPVRVTGIQSSRVCAAEAVFQPKGMTGWEL